MTTTRIWVGRLLTVIAITLAGLLGGWMFRQSSGEGSITVAESGGESESNDSEPAVKSSVPPSTGPQEDLKARPVNRLANETSPYLQLHKHNPIDWYPWGSEALDRAKREGKLIFLSIGYTACYWCHVMERESFNDAEIAAVLNESFVCIKVDREELPDVDEIFMNFVLMSNRGRGGWPLTVFLTPDARPIVGATYFPPRRRDDVDGLLEVLQSILRMWNDRRDDVLAQADYWTRAVQSASVPRGLALRPLGRDTAEEAVDQLAADFDPEFGGFGFDPNRPERPKFPQPCVLGFLNYVLRHNRDERVEAMLQITLHRMNRGGIWDCLGGGFHRYSVDRYWRVPHFEKMLYDNALLARVYLEAFELTKDRVFRRMAERIFQFIAREMTSPEGGFYSAIDAESEHEEGKYYVWTRDEVRKVLRVHEYELFASVQGLSGPPNFSNDRYVLQLVDSLAALSKKTGIHEGNIAGMLEQAAAKLLEVRNQRTRPLLDTKIMVDWNGLMIAALADGYRILGDEEYRRAAERAAQFILTRMREPNGRLHHVFAGGSAKIPGYLDDYAFLADGLLALHEATKDDQWLDASRSVVDQMNALFWDEEGGGYYHTAVDREVILARLKPAEDSALPSGNSAAALSLVRLAQRTGDTQYADKAARTIATFAGMISQSPGRFPAMVRAMGEYLDANYRSEWLGSNDAEPMEIVRAQAVTRQKKLAAGRDFRFQVVIEIDPNWHIYANPASSPLLVPTTLEIAQDQPLQNVQTEYPPAARFQPDGVQESVAVYARRIAIRVRATLDPATPVGATELQMSLRYQACNNERCLAPKSIELRLPVEVVAPDESKGE